MLFLGLAMGNMDCGQMKAEVSSDTEQQAFLVSKFHHSHYKWTEMFELVVITCRFLALLKRTEMKQAQSLSEKEKYTP